ncbi:hypothetical protein MTO96_049445 [Rhipicephalus appendiculatus]
MAFMESGIPSHLYDTALPSLDRCSVVKAEEDLKLQDLASVFYLYAAFCLASILVFMAEVFVNRSTPQGRRARRHRRLRGSVPPRRIFVRP